MKPGRELDALVHEKVFDLCAHDWRTDGHGDRTSCRKCGAFERTTAIIHTPEYSTEMGAAWAVVELLRRRGSLVSVSAQPEGFWIVSADKALNPRGDGTADGWDDTTPDLAMKVATPAHGICLVAVDYLLVEEVLDEYMIDCVFCKATRKEGHLRGCSVASMGPEVQEIFRKVRGPG